jgi:gliding motility-associated-like protein
VDFEGLHKDSIITVQHHDLKIISMKKFILFSFTILTSLFSQVILAQSTITKKTDPDHFDEKAAYQQAKAKGLPLGEIKGYVQFLKNDFSSKKALEKQHHKHSPYEPGSTNINETVIYLEPNKPMSLGCPNMGFEQYNFNGWTGSTGSVLTGPSGGNPTYNQTGSVIVNTAGNNVSPLNTINYHTIMTLPPTNNVYPTCAGYDSLAVRAVGSTTVSDIPFISPYSFDPVSVRLNNANGSRASRLKYITTTSSNNQRLSFSFAFILQDPTSPAHASNEAPYFKVEVRNEATGLVLPGCSSDDFNPKTATASDSLKTSAIQYASTIVKYRKWQYYSVDLSTLPSGTSVSVNFEVGGCSLGSHVGYGYVDAECGGIGTPYANMCSGSNFATLIAPTGFSSYQWYDPSGTLIAGATNDTLIQTPATPGTTYSVNMVSPSGCILSQTVTIGFTFVNITNLNSNSSCAGGHSGSASVQAIGSNGVYTYTWTSVTTGSIVSNSQTATNLAPDTYSVLVSSTSCGQASGNLSVGVSPPFYINLTKSFCGNVAVIGQAGGSNYVWYHGNTLMPSETNDSLYISPAVDGEIYKVVYLNPQGCMDSLIYTLSQIAGGNTYFSNTTNVCPNDSNGTTVLNLNTPFSAPYNYFITGPTAANTVSNTASSATSLTLTSLAPGTYSAVINDGTCIYNNTVSIGVIPTNFTITPTNTVLCFPNEATLIFDFGDVVPSSCGLSTNTICTSPNIIQVGSSNTSGSNSNYTPYGGVWESQKNQFLFRASELLAAGITPGKINSLAFNVTNTNGNTTTFENFTIKLKCVSYNTLSTTSMDNIGLVQVYNPTTINATTGWNTYNFSQAYDWDGTSNLLVDVCFFNPDWDGNLSVQYSNPGYVASKYVNNDGFDQCPLSLVDGTGTQRPNIRFGNCGASSPTSYTIAISSNGTITTNFNNDSIRVAPTSTIPPTGTGSVVYTFSVTNPIGGCVATQTVEVLYPPLTPTVLSTATLYTLCEGSNTTLSATGAANYNWYYYQGGAFTPIATTSSINVTPPSIGSNTYMVIGNAPCQNSIPDTSIITVNVTPMANLIITPLVDVTKCLNKSFTFNPSVGPTGTGHNGQPYSFVWTTLPGNAAAPGINTTSGYTTNSNTTTTLVVTVNGVCSTSTSDTVVVKNFVDDLSVAITNSIITCPNKALSLNSLTSGGYPVYSYYWSVNSTTVSNLSSLSFTSPSSGGTYTVGITVIDSCGYQDFDSDVVVVLPNTLNVSILDSATACGNTPFTLSSAANGGYPDYSYVWMLNSDVISTSQNLSYTTPASEGSYSVLVTATDSCGYQDTDVEIVNVLPPCMVIIPNVITPNGDIANDYFKIKNLEYHPNTSVTIFDRWGRKVYENPNYNNEWKAEGVADGTYFYIVDVPEDKKYNGFLTIFTGK